MHRRRRLPPIIVELGQTGHRIQLERTHGQAPLERLIEPVGTSESGRLLANWYRPLVPQQDI